LGKAYTYLRMSNITIHTPIAEIKSQFPSLSEDQIRAALAKFKDYDKNSDGQLDLRECTVMMEAMGQTKTVTELKQMIAEASGGQDSLSLRDFLGLTGGAGSNTALGRIYQTSLAKKAAYFEAQIKAQTKDKPPSAEEIANRKLDAKLKASQARAQTRAGSGPNKD